MDVFLYIFVCFLIVSFMYFFTFLIGQFNAAPTLLEKQQESLCARLKSLKEKQSLGSTFGVGSGNRSRYSSFSESIASSDFGLKKGNF